MTQCFKFKREKKELCDWKIHHSSWCLCTSADVMLVLLATLTSTKVEVISLSHLSDLRPYLRYGSYLTSLFALLSKFSVQTRATMSAFLYVQLPFLPDPAAERPNSHSLPHERGKGCAGSLQPCVSKQEWLTSWPGCAVAEGMESHSDIRWWIRDSRAL